MKKKFIFVPILSLLLAAPSFAQFGVIDVANLGYSIEQLYTMYDQVTSAIEQAENSWNQLQTQLETVKNIDWDNLDVSAFTSTGEGSYWSSFSNLSDKQKVMAGRQQIIDLTTAVNSHIEKLNNVENSFKDTGLTFNGKKYTYGSLLGIADTAGGNNTITGLAKSVADYFSDAAEEAAVTWSGNLTYQQRKQIMQKYGMSPESYYKVKLAEEATAGTMTKALIHGSDDAVSTDIDELSKDGVALNKMFESAGESFSAKADAIGQGELEICKWIKNIGEDFKAVASTSAMDAVQNKVKEEQDAFEKARAEATEASNSNLQSFEDKYSSSLVQDQSVE